MSQSRKLVSAVTCAVIACIATGAFAQTGEVYSLNVVGFEKVTAQSNGLSMVSTPFSKSPATLDDVVGGQLSAGKTAVGADNVTLWNATNQAYETYWLKTSDSRWHDNAGNLATNTSISPAMGFWVLNRNATNETVVVSGDVGQQPVVTNHLISGLNLVSYPFSTVIDINSSAMTNGTTGKTAVGADNITLWDASNQAYVTYWLKTSDKKWHDNGGNLATNVTVGSGKGFWYLNRAASPFDWVEARPYTL